MKFDFERLNDYQYVVKKGDTLYNIAKEFDVTVNDLLKANGLSSALIYPNQVLIIPLNNNGDVYFVEYVIKDNDTLEGIASKYNVTVNDLMNYNNLDKLYLVSEQVISVPQKANKHLVVMTDSIDYILNKYNMSLEELVDLNKDKLLIVNTYLNVK